MPSKPNEKKSVRRKRQKKVGARKKEIPAATRGKTSKAPSARAADMQVQEVRQLDVSEVARPTTDATSASAQTKTERTARRSTRARKVKKKAKKRTPPPAGKMTTAGVGEEPKPTAAVGGEKAVQPPTRQDFREGAARRGHSERIKPAGPVKTPDSSALPGVDAERPRRKRTRGRRGRRTKGEARHVPDQDVAALPKEPAKRARKADVEAVDEVAGDEVAPAGRAGREMVINVSGGDECRVAVLHEGRLEELFIERASTQSLLGNIYKGRVTNVESSIQAVFVDYGLPKNGFLHISDVQPQYFPDHTGETENVGRKIPRYHRPPIQKCFRRGQEVIIQITKDGVGTKGPTLTTYLSIPGRFLVMMPGMTRHGVSRKIEDESDRREMRQMLTQLTLPSGMGFILRTAGLGRSKRELQRDLNYLLRLWKTVAGRVKRLEAPAALYQESDLVTRTIRDVYTSDFTALIVDDAETAQKAREFLQIAMPRSKPLVKLYTEREPLFHRLGIEEEIERINMREVPLPSGGSLVIESTEALVAIDVNSGRFRSPEDAEETAFRINLEAAEEIARQLRLRDLGGLIVCDFIDMRGERHKREVERALRDGLKKHKERARTLRMSAFGLIEMTRQRQGPSLKRNIYYDCPHCSGSGLVKMPQSVILDVVRTIQLAAHNADVRRVTVTVASDVAFEILNKKRIVLSEIEAETGKEIAIRGDANFTSDQMECTCLDDRGRPVAIGPATAV